MNAAGETERTNRFLPIALATIAGLLLLPLMFQPVWRDEGTTVLDVSQRSFSAVLRGVHDGEASPPLYFLIEFLWVRIVGTSEFALRLPSLLAGAAAVGFLYDAARRIAGRIAGYTAAACAMMTPLFLFIGTEARPYALTLLLATLVLWLVSLLLCARRDTARIASALAVAIGALCWTHYTAWPVVVALTLAAPAINLGKSSNRKKSYYLAAVLAGGATALPLVYDFLFAARSSTNFEPDPVGTDLFHRIDARFISFNPLLIAEPVFVAVFSLAAALWLIRMARSWRRTGLTEKDQLLIVCLSIVVCGAGASVIRSAPTAHHLAAYAPAAWLIIGMFFARSASWLGIHSDIRKLVRWRKAGLVALCAIAIMTLAAFPLTYLDQTAPRSGSLALAGELKLLTGRPVMLIAVPDGLAPSLKYYLDTVPRARLRGIPTWSQPWFYGRVRELDPAEKLLVLDRIEAERRRCTRIAFAVDWLWKSFDGIDYGVAHDIVREESRLHGVAFQRVFPGTIETLDLVLLSPSCPEESVLETP